MNLARLVLPLACALVFSLAGTATAQPNPVNFRDGCATGTVEVPSSDVDVFTVPDGMDFILTDVQYECPYAPSVIGSQGELRWWRMGPGGAGSHSWATGLRFTAGQAVRLRLASTSSPGTFTLCWTGYLTPVPAPTSVVGGPKEQVGFRVGPNPATGSATVWFRLERPGPAKLAIYDAQGRLVRNLRSGNAVGGDQAVRWDGRDMNGKNVGAGLYFARLETSTQKRSAKIVRVE